MWFSLRNSLFISIFAKTYFLAYGKTTYIPIVKMERQSRKEATHTGRCKTSCQEFETVSGKIFTQMVGSHQSLAIREKQQFKNHQHPPLYALCSRQRIKGRKLVFQRKRQFLTKLPLSLVFHKQKCIKTAYL